jgi:arylsulfatase A-like enzyme
MPGLLVIALDDAGREQIPVYTGLADPADIPSLPVISGLAADGLRLDRFYATALCSPTRAAFHTGRYTFRTGMGNIVQGEMAIPLQASEPSLPKLLKQVGVRCGLFGKFHLGNSQNGGVNSPRLAAGYDYHSGTLRNILPNQGQTYYNWPWLVNGEDRGFCQEYATARTTTDAIRWISRQGSNPWFCHIAYQCPHEPWNGPPLGTYDDGRWGVVDPAGPPSEVPSVVQPFFKAMMENVDGEIGRLLASIPPAILADTQVVVFGDNGTPGPVIPAETHPAKGPYTALEGKQSTYESGIRLPCIISGAGVVDPGRASSALIHVIDLWRTAARFFGLSDAEITGLLPPGRIIDSLDISPVLENTASTVRENVVSELFGVNMPNPGTISGVRANVGPRYKIRHGGALPGGEFSFYDLDWLDANGLWETDPTADLTPGGVLTGLSDSDPLHPGERTAYFSLVASFQELLATYDDDLIL